MAHLPRRKSEPASTSLYDTLAAQKPNEVALGGALITLVEPARGYEQAYNRYYEDDHFYAGAMVGPWVFSGRRWVATRELRLLRHPSPSSVLNPVTAGCYLSLFWHLAGHVDEVRRWGLVAHNDHLYPSGRGFPNRENVFTTFAVYEFAALRDAGAPLRPEHALDHPFQG